MNFVLLDSISKDKIKPIFDSLLVDQNFFVYVSIIRERTRVH